MIASYGACLNPGICRSPKARAPGAMGKTAACRRTGHEPLQSGGCLVWGGRSNKLTRTKRAFRMNPQLPWILPEPHRTDIRFFPQFDAKQHGLFHKVA